MVVRFAQPTTGNVDRSVHLGAELSAIVKLFDDKIELFGNATLSKNTIEEGNTVIEYQVTDDSSAITSLNLDGNKITGFPDFLTNIGITFQQSGFYLRWTGKYVGEFYSDNYDNKLNSYLLTNPGFVDYTDNLNEAYFVSDVLLSYEFSLTNFLTPWKVYFQLNNIFDNMYSAYAIGKEFFPAAERNWLAGIQIGL